MRTTCGASVGEAPRATTKPGPAHRSSMSVNGVATGCAVPLREVDAHEPALGPLEVRGDDLVVAGEAVHRLAEHPHRLAELGRHRQDGDQRIAHHAIEVPPAAAVGDHEQLAARRPHRLHQRLVRTAGDAARGGRRTIGVEVGEPQFGALPGHARDGSSTARPAGRRRTTPRRGVEVHAAGEFGAAPPSSGRATRLLRGSGRPAHGPRAPRSGAGAGGRSRSRRGDAQARTSTPRAQRPRPATYTVCRRSWRSTASRRRRAARRRRTHGPGCAR